jgi:iron complex outermembrane receptor protein
LNSLSIQLENKTAAQQSRISPSYGEDNTPAYSIFNVRSTYALNWNDKRFELTAGVENIFDKKYHNHLDWGNITRPGRNIIVNVAFAF